MTLINIRDYMHRSDNSIVSAPPVATPAALLTLAFHRRRNMRITVTARRTRFPPLRRIEPNNKLIKCVFITDALHRVCCAVWPSVVFSLVHVHPADDRVRKCVYVLCTVPSNLVSVSGSLILRGPG